MLDKILEQSPQLAVLAFLVVIFLKHIGRSEKRYDSLVSRVEEVIQRNTEALGASTSLLEKARKALYSRKGK